ncbi:hypothetical protein CERZMDRAFT_86563 [Cercospora zeae-maydis SCOH1-5]|uniref:Uncharacterized protein n=1 Tax=Cercospora zeae-maydis SCOH1-5 TaxID=717836 RepID=A0A6A6F959_9PEZI|nr:hypothetical protein CERZMDRAFT_86563 [Cercospora zeae-maydis SCOH1-5]
MHGAPPRLPDSQTPRLPDSQTPNVASHHSHTDLDRLQTAAVGLRQANQQRERLCATSYQCLSVPASTRRSQTPIVVGPHCETAALSHYRASMYSMLARLRVLYARPLTFALLGVSARRALFHLEVKINITLAQSLPACKVFCTSRSSLR